ncbi:NACHT and WD repeat domain-containing protein, partial [Nocardia sp. NPDC003979]
MSERLELFPVAIATYADTRFQRLSVGTEVAKIAAALADFDIHTVEWDTESDQRGHKAVNNRLKRWAESSVPQTVLYWVGHGWSDGRDTALAHTDSPVVVDTEGFTPRQIAKTIATRGSNIANDDAVAGGQPWIIVVVDACRSAAFVRELKAEMMRRAPGLGVGYLLIGGLSGEGATTLGRFSQELRFFLETVCATDFIIPLHRMAVHFQTQGAEVEQKWLIDEVVLHRRHAMLVNLDLDTRHQLLTALDALDDDELRHFLPKAYGGEMPFTETMLGEQSWYFQGRHEETRRITDWLNQAETGMLIVTGSAGSGKSALLGHLIVHANATLRTALQRANLTHPLPATEQPPDNVFDAVLHLTGATMDEVVARLSALTGLRTSTAFIRSAHGLDEALNHLIEEIGRLKRPVTILVDALDEAVEPLLVASRILVVLANTPRVRIVVGTRGSTREAPDQSSSDSDILDTLQSARSTTVQISADATAVANYVRARLQSSRIPLIDPAGVRIDLDALVAQVHKRAPQFLFARLLVHELLADPHQRTAAAWTRLLAGNHRSLFATAVTRLTTDRPVLMAVLKALAFARGRGLPAADDIWLFAAQALNTDPATAVNNNDIDQLTHVAAAYILADREHGQTVFRMAHRTFTEYFTNDIDPTAFDRDHHNEITNALITNAIRQTEEVLAGTRSLNPYYTHYLPAHAAAAGQQGWDVLNRHTALLITLDPGAVAANAWRSSSGRYPLPETISAITTLNTHLQPLHPRDRYLPIQIENHHTRHQTPPAWTPPITVEATTNAPSSPHRILTGHTDPVRALAFVEIPDGRTLLASTGDDDTVRLWDPATGRAHGQPLIGHTGSVRALTSVVLPDEHTLLASGGDDDTVRLWDPTTNRANGRPLTGHTGSVRALTSVILPDGETLLASGGEDRTVRLWLPSNSQERSWPLRGHTGAVRAITSVVLSDGRALLASGGDDRTIRLWDPANTWRNREPLTGHIGAVRALTSVVLRNGHTLIASSGDDRTVRLWDPATNRAHGRPMTGHTGAVRALTSVVLRNGHTLIASSGDDRTVRLWD